MNRPAPYPPNHDVFRQKRRWFSGKVLFWAGVCGVGAYAADYFINSNVVIQYAKTPFNEKIIQNCSELQKKKFYPTWYLSPALFQTVYGALYAELLDFPYKRELLQFEDGGDAALDWAPLDPAFDKEDQKILFVLHGLSGGSDCIYMKDAVASGFKNGFRTVAFNLRGLTHNPIKTPEFHDLSDISDVVVAINHVKQKYPNAPLYGLGISFGGNMLLKYAGQEKEKCLFNSIVTVANPFNLSVCAEQIHKPKRFIYHNRLLWAFLTVIRQNEEQLRKNPKINVDDILASKTINEYDERFSCKLKGYTLEEYRRKASCEDYVKDVKIPMLCLNALDDPVSEKNVIPWQKLQDNQNFIMLATQKGGHVDFFINHKPVRWVNIVAMQYLNFIDQELKEGKLQKKSI